MSILSNLFGGNDDSTSFNGSDGSASGDVVGDISSVVGLDFDSSQSSYNQDEDGNISSFTNDNGFGLDASTDGLLGAIGDLTGSSQSYAEQS